MISLIRDYLDVLSGILNISHSYFDIVKVTLVFCGQSLIHFFQYLITFGWFRDIMYLPILLPKYQQLVLSERFFYEDLNVEFFQHLADSSNGIFGACNDAVGTGWHGVRVQCRLHNASANFCPNCRDLWTGSVVVWISIHVQSSDRHDDSTCGRPIFRHEWSNR